MKSIIISQLAILSAGLPWTLGAVEHQTQNGELSLASCQQVSAQQLQARYLLTTTQIAETSKHKQQNVRSYNEFDLIRKGEHKVAYHYPDLGLSDIWTQQNEQQVSLLKAFHQHKKAIDYDAIEVSDLIAQRWHKLYNLVSPQLLKQLTPGNLQGEGCLQTRRYSGMLNGEFIQINWLTQLQLPQSIDWTSKEQFRQYKLKGIEANSALYFHDIENYQSTDFADIGDNEADEFLQKMINMGFVHHSHESVYDAQGHRKH